MFFHFYFMYVFENIPAKAFNQYKEGTRNALLTSISETPILGSAVILVEEGSTLLGRWTIDELIRVTEDGSVRIVSDGATDGLIFTSVSSYVKLGCFTSSVDEYVLKFG